MLCKNQISFYYGKSFSQQCRCSNSVICVSVLKVTSTIVFCRFTNFHNGGGMHGLFKCICRSGAIPEKALRIWGGAMQVYHHNQ